ncbi:MAG: hypothetical protein RL033_7364 [Pseudomonadota bacterium]
MPLGTGERPPRIRAGVGGEGLVGAWARSTGARPVTGVAPAGARSQPTRSGRLWRSRHSLAGSPGCSQVRSARAPIPPSVSEGLDAAGGCWTGAPSLCAAASSAAHCRRVWRDEGGEEVAGREDRGTPRRRGPIGSATLPRPEVNRTRRQQPKVRARRRGRGILDPGLSSSWAGALRSGAFARRGPGSRAQHPSEGIEHSSWVPCCRMGVRALTHRRRGCSRGTVAADYAEIPRPAAPRPRCAMGNPHRHPTLQSSGRWCAVEADRLRGTRREVRRSGPGARDGDPWCSRRADEQPLGQHGRFGVGGDGGARMGALPGAQAGLSFGVGPDGVCGSQCVQN